MKMKKLTAILMSMALGVSVLAGCGSSDNGSASAGSTGSTGNGTGTAASSAAEAASGENQDVTLKIWVPEEEVEFTGEMVEKFDEIHDEFNINYEIAIVGIDEAAGQLETDADIAADIFY
ncbi:MAG: sugar ABC transporter substrate-binding protein, partial [Lachnospiraceae bacterium]|nr:sugar ABC transporter substrate-binding protein [Lachnospiraceae bacterium]